jgi:NADH:ubiquinone oxidoreductase subunit 3 (subunit A)
LTLIEFLTSPIVIAAYALVVGLVIYAWSRTVAPAFTPSVNKTMPYVGGEPATGQVSRPGYQFFSVALFFTVVHVAALVLAIAPMDAPLWATLGYLAIITTAVMVLRSER